MDIVKTGADIVRNIIERYPSPKKKQLNRGEDYCVGGAFCLFQRATRTTNFPTVNYLGEQLQLATNFRLNKLDARSFAAGIISKNDIGDFIGAWATLATALDFKSKN